MIGPISLPIFSNRMENNKEEVASIYSMPFTDRQPLIDRRRDENLRLS